MVIATRVNERVTGVNVLTEVNGRSFDFERNRVAEKKRHSQ